MSRLFDFDENNNQGQFKKNTALMLLLLGLLVPLSIKAEPLPSKTELYIGSIMPLTVESGFKDIAYYSENMKRGLEAALANPADPSIHIRFEVADGVFEQEVGAAAGYEAGISPIAGEPVEGIGIGKESAIDAVVFQAALEFGEAGVVGGVHGNLGLMSSTMGGERRGGTARSGAATTPE